MNGFLLIDKAKGPNSFKIVTWLRKALNMKRIGFAGTLDPLASGLMLVALGEATKLLTFLEKADKVYEVEILFGATSDTYDAEGKISALDVQGFVPPSRQQLEQILHEEFTGEIQQIPPMHSAIQIDGKRAYDLARKGHKIELKARVVRIFEVEILTYSFPRLRLKVWVSSGTYIRSLAHDLGERLGCGGLVQELRRTKIGRFLVKDACALEDVNALNIHKYLQRPEEFLADWLRVDLDDEEYRILSLGNFIENRFGIPFLESYLDKPVPILAIWKDKTVGILEFAKNRSQLKFWKKFIIF